MTAVADDWRHAETVQHLPDVPNDTLIAVLRRELRRELATAPLPADVEAHLARDVAWHRPGCREARRLLAAYSPGYQFKTVQS